LASVATRLGVEGVVVVRPAPGSPAERAGLRDVDFNTAALGDVIVAVNDTTVRRLSDLTDELERNGVGKTVRLTVQRDGRTRTVETEAPHLVSRPRTTKFPSRALQDLQKCRSYKDMTGMSSKTPRGG